MAHLLVYILELFRVSGVSRENLMLTSAFQQMAKTQHPLNELLSECFLLRASEKGFLKPVRVLFLTHRDKRNVECSGDPLCA